MTQIFVAGLINLETTLRVEGFPIAYSPVRFPCLGVQSSVSGVGFNIAKALTTLGDTLRFASLVGQDAPGDLAARALDELAISRSWVLHTLRETAQSVILYDGDGRRQINTDLKDIQEQPYPLEQAIAAMEGCELAVLCNINFARPLLALARERGLPIATDVHAIRDLDDPYNRDWMAAADILFQSHEKLPCPPESWARQAMERYGNRIIVVGMGGAGALLAVRDDGFVGTLPAVATRPIVSTIGAGDALFSAFLHFYSERRDPYEALRRAVVFASYKIGAAGAAQGFLEPTRLAALYPIHRQALAYNALPHRTSAESSVAVLPQS